MITYGTDAHPVLKQLHDFIVQHKRLARRRRRIAADGPRMAHMDRMSLLVASDAHQQRVAAGEGGRKVFGRQTVRGYAVGQWPISLNTK